METSPELFKYLEEECRGFVTRGQAFVSTASNSAKSRGSAQGFNLPGRFLCKIVCIQLPREVICTEVNIIYVAVSYLPLVYTCK